MKKILTLFGVLICFLGFGQFGTDVFTIGSDNASNYGGSWTNGSNQGSGFGAWGISAGANTGVFIGNPGSDGMGTSGIGTSAFAVYATGGNYINISRSINNGIRVGDILTFYWAMNYDAGGGSKGFNLKSSATTIFNVNNAGSSTISTTNGNANTNYGTSPMLVTLERISSSSYSFSMTARDGGATYTTTISSSSTIDEIEIYSGNQNDGAGQKNIYFNNFTITSKYTIPSSQTSTVSSNISVPYIDIQSGGTLISEASNSRELTISSNGNFTNNGPFTANDGKVIFSGSNTVSGSSTFNNIDLNGGVDFGSSSTVNGNISLNAGGFINTNAPSYGGSSILIYNSSTTYGRGTEWSSTSGAGYPNNIQITNNTTLNLGANAGTGTARQCAGNLTVDAGSTLSLNESGEQMTQALTVKGNFINNGTVLLSGASGGDLKLEGDFDDNGTFTANSRAVFFEGGNTQTINSTADPLEIDVMRIGKSGGEVVMNQNLLADETSDPIQFTTATSYLNLNGNTLTIGKAGVTSSGSFTAGSGLKGTSASSLVLLGNGSFGDIPFVSGSQTLNNLSINRGGSGSIGLGSDVTIEGTLTLTQGDLQTNSNKVTLGTSGTVVETGGTVIGNLEATRTLSNSTEETFGIMGISITPSCDNLGSTAVTRTTGTPISDNSLNSISRYFQVTPTTNGKATVIFSYTDSEISAFTEANSLLFTSTDNSADSWYQVNGNPTISTPNNTLELSVNSLNYFTISDNTGFGEGELFIERSSSGYALSFDGTTSYVELGNAAALTFTTAMTVECWFKTTSTLGNYQTLVSKWYSGGAVDGGSYALGFHSGGLQFSLQDEEGASANDFLGANYSSGLSLNDGVWHHVAGTWDGTSAKIYVDGILRDTQTSASMGASLDGNTRKVRIGTDDRFAVGTGDRFFPGQIDEVRFWDTPLNISDIQNWMNRKITPDHPDYCNLKGYYRFDENTGTILKDYTGNTDGTISGATYQTSSAPTGGDGAINATSVTDATTLNLASAAGDDITVNVTSGTADLLQVIRVDGSPNNKTNPGGIDNMSAYNYFVVKAFGASSFAYEVVYNYDGHAGIADESELYLCSRADNASSWTLTSATRDTDASTLTLGGQTGTEFILGSGIPGNALPVDLIDFKIENQDGKANLIWATASELNSKSFEILRSTDAKNWKKVGEVMAQGNSNILNNYQFVDSEKLNVKFTYYKLKQVDLNGEYTFSNALLFETENNIQTKIYPNPTSDNLTFQFGNNVERNIKISNLMGEQIMSLPTISNMVFNVNISKLPKGFYFVEIESGGQVEVKKILKQ